MLPKVIFFISLIIIIYVIYYLLQPSSTNEDIKNLTPQQIIDRIKDSNPKPSTEITPIFYFGSKAGNLYMKDMNGDYWDAGKTADCVGLTSSDSMYIIQNIYKVALKKDIPKELRSQCSGNDDSLCAIIVQKASDFEDSIIKKIKGKFTPNSLTCIIKPGEGDDPSKTAEMLGKSGNNVGEFFETHKEEFISIVELVGEIAAVEYILGKFCSTRIFGPIIAPLVIMLNALSEDMTQIESAGYQSVAIFISEAIKIFNEKSAISLSKTASAELVSASIVVADEVAGQVTVAFSSLFSSVMSFLGPIVTSFEMLMLVGMVLDMFDVCKLESSYMTQDMLDDLRNEYDKQLFILFKGNTYPTVWDVSNMCEYGLSQDVVWERCLSDEEKKITPKEVYCKEDHDKIRDYATEYRNKLTVNSYGQCLRGMSNSELAYICKSIAPGYNWDLIANLTQSDIQSITLPTNDILKKLDLFMTNNNIIVASYVNHYWYVISAFITLLLGMFVFL